MSKKIVSLLVLGSLLAVLLVPGMVSAAVPTITLVAPSQGAQGSDNLQVNITGTGFNTTKSVAFSGSGITVDSFATSSDTAIRVIIDIAGTAEKTARNITITNADGPGTSAGAFTVIAGVIPSPIGKTTAAPECCKLKRDITVRVTTYTKDTVVGKTGGECAYTITQTSDYWGTYCLLNTIYGVTDLLFAIVLALAILFFVYGALTMVMASGDTEKFTTGKNYIMYALIGIVVAFLARAFPSIIKTAMGV